MEHTEIIIDSSILETILKTNGIIIEENNPFILETPDEVNLYEIK